MWSDDANTLSAWQREIRWQWTQVHEVWHVALLGSVDFFGSDARVTLEYDQPENPAVVFYGTPEQAEEFLSEIEDAPRAHVFDILAAAERRAAGYRELGHGDWGTGWARAGRGQR